ncbi:helix-turn-helix domain-containing protein [Roseococcus pinisoli]|uniref:Helix-turn-helix domain-containing protein n=1 Tax=Roseococcus pinisoli TaxID=2835040 RepID=A0ABS5QBL2_9PROT|nr:helix-turn-helix domain-containing protein [Roseococcus pinisoli]MBS7810322.1 helix-turn-helix domain-containing protein [Roseococcus pinisoli]
MIPEVVSTHSLPPAHQLGAWRSWFDSVFEVERPFDAKDGFPAESRHWALGELGFGHVSAPGLCAVRTAATVRRNPVDHWVIAVGKHDTGVRTPGDSLLIPAQTPFIVSLGDSLASERVADERLHLYLPRDAFADIAPQLDAARNTVLTAGLGKLLGDFMRNLARELPRLAPEDLPRVTSAVRAMVGACVVPTADRMVIATGQIDATRLQKIRHLIRRNIESPELNAAMLCGALDISRTQLYRLMQGEGGVEHYIRRLRLEACRDRLLDATRPGTIGEIAAGLGFEDASQFSRAFRREFGVSPREIRIAALAGESHAALTEDWSGGRPLRDLLRNGEGPEAA